MKAKAKRLASADPKTKVDSSTWTPPEALNADVKTGMRPLTKRAYKKGGKVIGKAEGDKAMHRADRKPRASGGKLAKYIKGAVKNLGDNEYSEGYRSGQQSVAETYSIPGEAEEGGNPIQMKNRRKGIDLALKKMTGKAKIPARASGGKIGKESSDRSKRYLTPDNLINRDEKMANEVREGKKHVGGLKTGGKAKKFGGGDVVGDNPVSVQSRSMGQAAGMMKKGGKIKGRERHSGMDGDNVAGRDEIGELIRKLPKSEQKNVAPEQRQVPKKKTDIDDYLKPSTLDAERAANAAAFDEEQRQYLRNLPQNQKRGGKVKNWEGSKKDEAQDRLLAKKYGISMEKWEKSKEDKKHDKQQSMKGLKKGGSAHGDDCSCKMCSGGRTMKYAGGGVFSGEGYPGKVPGVTGGREAHKKGGKSGKGKMNVNIVIAAGHRNKEQEGMPNAPVPAPLSPRTPPAGMGAPMPPPGMMPPGGGSGAGPMPPPGLMPRKNGGRTIHVINHAAGGGLGRLEKIDAYGKKHAKAK